MDLPVEEFFLNMLCLPFIIVLEEFLKTIILYHQEVVYWSIKLWHRESGINVGYFIPILNELACLSEMMQYSAGEIKIIRLVLGKERIGTEAVFGLKGDDRKCIIRREDFVESILRRGVRKIKLKKLK